MRITLPPRAARRLAVIPAVLAVLALGAVAVHDGSPGDSRVLADGGPGPAADDTLAGADDLVPTTAEPVAPPAIEAPTAPAETPAPAPAPTAPRPKAPAPAPQPRLSGSGLYTTAPDGAGLRRLVTGVTHYPAWAPDGSKIAYVRDNQVRVVAPDGSGDKALAASPFRPRWSPDSQKIAYLGDGGLSVVDVATGSRRLLAGGDYRELDWSPDGSRLLVVSNTTLSTVDAASGALNAILSSCGQDGGAVWGPDSRRVGYLDYERGPSVVDVDTKQITPLAGQRNMGWRMSWAPDGTRLAFANYENFSANNLAVANADGSGVRTVTAGGVAPAWSPDGARIAYQTYRNPDGRGRLETELHVIGVDGASDRALTTNGRSGVATSPAWSPDGRTIAFTYNSG